MIKWVYGEFPLKPVKSWDFVWCDASYCKDSSIAFGAYMSSGMAEPFVFRVSGYSAKMAEIDALVVATLSSRSGSVIVTDLADLKRLFDYKRRSVRALRSALGEMGSGVVYVDRSNRSHLYRLCHNAALAALKASRQVE